MMAQTQNLSRVLKLNSPFQSNLVSVTHSRNNPGFLKNSNCSDSTLHKHYQVCTPEKAESPFTGIESHQKLDKTYVITVTKCMETALMTGLSSVDHHSSRILTDETISQTYKHVGSEQAKQNAQVVGPKTSASGDEKKEKSCLGIQEVICQPTFYHQSYNKMCDNDLCDMAPSSHCSDYPSLTVHEREPHKSVEIENFFHEKTINTIVPDNVITLVNNFQNPSSLSTPINVNSKVEGSRSQESQTNFLDSSVVCGAPYDSLNRHDFNLSHEGTCSNRKLSLLDPLLCRDEHKFLLPHVSMNHSSRQSSTVDTFCMDSNVALTPESTIEHDTYENMSLIHLSKYNSSRHNASSFLSNLSHDSCQRKDLQSPLRWCIPQSNADEEANEFHGNSLSNSFSHSSLYSVHTHMQRNTKECSVLSAKDILTQTFHNKFLSPAYETSHSDMSFNQNSLSHSDALTRLFQIDSHQPTPHLEDSQSLLEKQLNGKTRCTTFDPSYSYLVLSPTNPFIYHPDSIPESNEETKTSLDLLCNLKNVDYDASQLSNPLRWASPSQFCLEKVSFDESAQNVLQNALDGQLPLNTKTRGVRGVFNNSECSGTAQLTLIVNVPTTTTRQDLLNAFKVFGQVLMPTVVCRRETRHPKKEWTATAGYAFVLFESKSSAEAALAATDMGHVIIRGTSVKATWAKKDSFYSQSELTHRLTHQHHSVESSSHSSRPNFAYYLSQTFPCETYNGKNQQNSRHSFSGSHVSSQQWKPFLPNEKDQSTLKEYGCLSSLEKHSKQRKHMLLKSNALQPPLQSSQVSSHPEEFFQWLNISIPDKKSLSPSMTMTGSSDFLPNYSPLFSENSHVLHMLPGLNTYRASQKKGEASHRASVASLK